VLKLVERPKKKVKKQRTVYLNIYDIEDVYKKTSYVYDTKKDALMYASPECTAKAVPVTVEYEVEE